MSQTSNSWTVVEFTDTKTVEAVPTGWLLNNECYWPPMARSKIMAEIKNSVFPNTCWPLYQIRVFKDGTYDDYLTARRKAIKAEDTSDLQSDADPNPKRKIIKRKILQSSSESETESENQIPIPPNIRLSLPRPTNAASLTMNLTSNVKDNTLKDALNTPAFKPPQYKFKPSKRQQFHLKTPEKLEFHLQTLEESPSTRAQPHCDCQGLKEKFDKFSKELSENMVSLKANMYQIREDLTRVLANQNNAVADNEQHFIQMFPFPIKEKELMTEIDNYLSVEDNYRQSVNQIAKLGGKDTYDFIRRCFRETVADVLSKEFTFDGTKNKASFKETKLCSLFLAASEQHNGANKKSSEEAIRKWLRRANERFQHKK